MQKSTGALSIIVLIIGAILGYAVSFAYHPQINQLSDENYKLKEQVNQLSDDNSQLKSQVNQLSDEISQLSDQMNTLQADFEKLSEEKNDLQAKYDALVALQPKIMLVDVVKYHAVGGGLCAWVSPGSSVTQTVGATFWLVNAGDANWVAMVQLTGGGRILAQSTYFVGIGERAYRTLGAEVSCDSRFEVSLSIVEIKKS